MILRMFSAVLVPLTLMWATPATALPVDFRAKADAVLAETFPADGPGGAVVVMEHGKIVYSAGRGLADIENKRPITPNAVFRLGSTTKQFTAAVILQLAEEGKLSLSDPLSKFLPDYPKPGADATVAQLLNHTSGIVSFTKIPGWMDSDKRIQKFTTEGLIAAFQDMPVEFAAGTKFAYNNSGYVLLAAIIEKITGKPWYEAIEQRITRPMGLKTIQYGARENEVSAMVRGYSLDSGKFVPSRPIDMSVPSGAGSLIGTVGDLAKWAKALHGGKVVNSESYRQMIAPTRRVSGEVFYGFGLIVQSMHGRCVIHHGGDISGFKTMDLYFPADDLFVAVFENLDDPRTPPEIPAYKLAGRAIG